MALFSSTEQTNSDPLPWRANGGNSADTRWAEPGDPRWKRTYAPRPEFDSLPSNSVLLVFRREAQQLGVAYVEDWLRVTEPGFLPSDMEDQREHAEKVLLRLRALS